MFRYKLSSLFTFAALCFFLGPQQLVYAISVDELADICEAMESAIHDTYVEYEWSKDPPPKPDDLPPTGLFMDNGRHECQWATARPFADRSLTSLSTIMTDEHGDSFNMTRKQSYNGKVGKLLDISDQPNSSLPRLNGTITKSRRFMPPRNLTPEGFTIISFYDDLPLSKALRQKESTEIELDTDAKKINGFNTICANFWRKTKKGTRVWVYRVHFSVDHGYTPVRIVHTNGRDPIQYIDVNTLEEVSDGIWYPTSGRMRYPGEKTQTVYTASKVIVNRGLTDEYFDLEFPPGTKISDEIVGSSYLIKPTEEQFNKWLEGQTYVAARNGESDRRVVETLPPPDTVQNSPPGTTQDVPSKTPTPVPAEQSQYRIYLYMLSGILIIVVGALVLKRLSAKGKNHEEH